MAQLTNVRRIIVEDFPSDQQDLISRLAPNINNFMEEVVQLSRKRIDYENLARSKVQIDVTVDSTGKLINTNGRLFTNLSSLSGHIVINAANLTNNAVFPTAPPWVNYTNLGNGYIQIISVLGLPANNKFKLTIEFIQ